MSLFIIEQTAPRSIWRLKTWKNALHGKIVKSDVCIAKTI